MIATPCTEVGRAARAHRFPIRAPLFYRDGGQSEWSAGTTINISRSGVLFQSGRTLPLKTTLELRILFPAAITGGAGADVVCCGSVVRNEPPGATAAAILHYRFDKLPRA